MPPSSPARVIAWALAALIILAAVPPAEAAPQVTLGRTDGGIVFTFNGGWASNTVAAQTLEAHGMRGTFYVASGLLRSGPDFTSYMSASDVANLSARGHDIESNTVTQPDLTTVDSARLASELSDSKSALQIITGKQVKHVAYPYGAVNDAVAAATAARYASGRTISWSINDFTPTVDAYHVPGFIVRQATTLTEAKWIVDYSVSHNVQVVLSFEKIVTNPGTYDWTPSNLDALAAYVQSKNVRVVTISQLVTGAAPPALPPPPPGTGTIVFVLDDGYTSQLPAAQKLLDNGMRGTFMIVSNCAHGGSGGPCMSNAQVKTLSQQGHDIEPHTVTHPDLTTLSGRKLTSQLKDSQADLRTLTGTPNEHTAYPFGSHNAAVRLEAAKYYKTARITLTSPAVSELPTLIAQSGLDPMLVPGIGITRGTSLDKAKSYVDYAIARNTTVILVLHDFLNSGGDNYTWDIASFNALVDYVKAKQVKVRTIAQVYG